MSNEKSSPRTLKTVNTATGVIRGLIELDGAGLTELATHLELSKSTAYMHLTTLEQQGLITKEDGQYQLSYQFLFFGEYTRSSSLLYEIGQQEADRLANELGHYAHLAVEENGLGANIYQTKGEKAVDYDYQASKLQQYDKLHMTAYGKAILAHLPDERVSEIIDQHGLDQQTDRTITDEDSLLDELETIRERGVAYNDEEEVNGFRAIAAPVQTTNPTILGSVSVSGPTSYFDDTVFFDELPEQVSQAANNIEVSINMMQRG